VAEGIQKAIEELEDKRRVLLAEVARVERMVNELLVFENEPPRYVVAGTEQDASRKRSRFYGKRLATAVREYLDGRAGEPATTEEILSALEAGDFDFDGLGWKRDTRLRSLAMSLAKNTATFHRLPSGAFGLLDWYPSVAGNKRQRASGSTPDKDEPAANGPAPDEEVPEGEGHEG